LIILAGTSDVLRLVTSAAGTIHSYASLTEINTGVSTVDGNKQGAVISTATTTTIVAAPASGVRRSIKTLTVRNAHATTANIVTVQAFDGTTAFELYKVNLAAGETLIYQEQAGFFVHDAQGRVKSNDAAGGSGAAVNQLNLVTLASDVINNNATANTMADITGLQFSVTSGETYWFLFTIAYQAAATTTGSRWSITGPASPTILAMAQQNTLTVTTSTLGNNSAYDTPAASNATSAVASALAGNVARIEGIIRPSSNGTVTARFASEVAASAITAKAGSLLQWVRTL
jgi:hypothetical protein